MSDRDLINRANELYGKTDLPPESDREVMGTPSAEIADRYYSGVRLNQNGAIEAEFTDRNGNKSYLDTNEIRENVQRLQRRIDGVDDPLSITSPTDVANADQLARGLMGIGEMASDLTNDGFVVRIGEGRDAKMTAEALPASPPSGVSADGTPVGRAADEASPTTLGRETEPLSPPPALAPAPAM